MSRAAALPPLFERSPRNPILTALDWPYPAHTVFNPGATRLGDGTTLLLCRVEDHRGHSHLTAARSTNGVDAWRVDPTPTFPADPVRHPSELWGVEDPRITWLAELGCYGVVYTAFGERGPGVALALTEDFVTFERRGLVLPPDDKDAALLPRRIGGKFVMVHRPTRGAGGEIWVSYSSDLVSWGGQRLMLPARRGGWWDAHKIGLSPPLVETPAGWLMVYHGVRQTARGAIYRLGLALFELERPDRCLLRGSEWVFGPEAPYELVGDVGHVVFPCGAIVDGDGDTLRLYYGSADTTVSLATGSVRGLLEWLSEHGTSPPP